MVWFKDYGFNANPYRKLDPFKVSLDRFEWNRTDMPEAYSSLTQFVNDLSSGEKSGLRVVGAIGSGKTWFARIIEKHLLKSAKDSIFVYTKVPKIEPTFSNVYSIAIRDILTDFDRISAKVKIQTGSSDEKAWLKVFDDEDLARGLSAITSGGKNSLLAKSWLMGNRMTASILNTLNIVTPITSDYKRFQTLIELFRSLSALFSCAVLVVDELENAPIKLAGGLSDSLRDMLSEFTEKFGLVCLFTAESFDEWYEAGYTEALTRRIDYHVSISELEGEAVLELVKKHHTLYRTKDFKENQLFPFKKEAVLRILALTSEGRKYPGYFLPNCEAIAKLTHEQNHSVPIGSDFVERNIDSLPYSELSF